MLQQKYGTHNQFFHEQDQEQEDLGLSLQPQIRNSASPWMRQGVTSLCLRSLVPMINDDSGVIKWLKN